MKPGYRPIVRITRTMGRTRSMSSALMAAVTACAVLGGEVLRLSHPCFVLAAGVSAGVVGCWRSASSAGEPLTMHSTEHAARHPQLCTGSQVPPCRSCEMCRYLRYLRWALRLPRKTCGQATCIRS